MCLREGLAFGVIDGHSIAINFQQNPGYIVCKVRILLLSSKVNVACQFEVYYLNAKIDSSICHLGSSRHGQSLRIYANNCSSVRLVFHYFERSLDSLNEFYQSALILNTLIVGHS